MQAEWKEKRETLADQFSETLAEVPLPERVKEETVYLMMCGLAKGEWPLEWAEFDRKLYSLH